jgi:hypothetical protein
MECKERRVPWAPASIERDKITRLLPSDGVTERDVTFARPNGETRRFRFDGVLASRLLSEAGHMLAELPKNDLGTTFKVEDSEWVEGSNSTFPSLE